MPPILRPLTYFIYIHIEQLLWFIAIQKCVVFCSILKWKPEILEDDKKLYPSFKLICSSVESIF